MKQQVTIEVDVPEGMEIDFVQTVIELDGDKKRQCLVVRFKDDWQWPAWLTAPWIACDSLMNWYAFTREPEFALDKETGHALNWQKQYGTYCFISPMLYAFTPPPCTDWRQSKRRRPGS